MCFLHLSDFKTHKVNHKIDGQRLFENTKKYDVLTNNISYSYYVVTA